MAAVCTEKTPVLIRVGAFSMPLTSVYPLMSGHHW
nr:MAG TPA: hypothetical protein [Caudoviricetes sp.]